MRGHTKLSVLTASTPLLLLPSLAWAHHPTGGQTPATFGDGLLSGLGHPIIGADHFVFVVAVGLLAALGRPGAMLALAFLGTTLIGTLVHAATAMGGGMTTYAEAMVMLSVVAVGIVLARRNTPAVFWLSILGVVAGLVHGYAFGASVIGAEATPLLAYLLGLALIQSAVVVATAIVARSLVSAWRASGREASLRPAGWAVTGMGVAWMSNLWVSSAFAVGA